MPQVVERNAISALALASGRARTSDCGPPFVCARAACGGNGLASFEHACACASTPNRNEVPLEGRSLLGCGARV